MAQKKYKKIDPEIVLRKKTINDLKSRQDYLNFIKRIQMETGKPWFHFRYRASKNLDNDTLKRIALDYYINYNEVAEVIMSAPDWINKNQLSRLNESRKWKGLPPIKGRYKSTHQNKVEGSFINEE